MLDGPSEQLDDRVLVLAPTARDAATTRDLLKAAGLHALSCATIDEVCREARCGAGAAILTAEAVLGDRDAVLAEWLQTQPPWSDFPLIVLTPPGTESPRLLAALAAIGHMTLMQRPIQISAFVSTVHSALRDRRRQYAVRDLLEERRRDAETLREERERYRVTLASIGDGIIATDTEARVTFLNQVAEQLTGWDSVSARGVPLTQVFHIVHEATRHPMPNPALRALQEGTTVGLANHTVLVARDGTERPIDDSAAPIRNAAGEPAGAVLVFRDVTVPRRTEAALREADRRKDDFIALLAHELRNPLAPLRNGLQVMRLADRDVNVVAQARAMMDRQLGHMVRLIDDLLDVSRISRNKMELRRTRVLLSDVVGSAVEAARPLIDAAGHQLSISLPPEPVFLDADLTRLAQVLSNLLTNSAKYTERGGRIWLAAELRDGSTTVTVRDTGIGIPAEALPRIFDMFSQVDRSIERSTGGLGIGLALVKGLVEMHGGTVAAESGGQGKGSTFTVTLPVLASCSELAGAVPDAGPAHRGPKRRILVVDDNRDSAVSMATMLTLLGHEVSTAHDGIEAVQVADRCRPQVILMDVGMPRLNGLNATRRIREQPWGKGMRIIALTGWGQDADRERSREAGCDGHLVKPVSLADLEKMLVGLAVDENSNRR
jgi:PAS domain S-box-containing protein